MNVPFSRFNLFKPFSGVSVHIQQFPKHRFVEKTVHEGPNVAERQREVLQLLTEGKSMKRVAYALNVSKETVAFHKYRIRKILNVKNDAELVQYAVRSHIIAA